MAPLPTINNVYRIRIIWASHEGITPVNIFHVHADGNNADNVGGDIGDSMTNAMFANMHQDQHVDAVGVTKLDGSSAELLVPLVTPIEPSGGMGETIPNTACVVSLRTSQRGARGRGRVYLGPTLEAWLVNGFIEESVRAEVQAAWITFASDLQAFGDPIDLGVASYTHADFHSIAGITADRVAGTQRRRLDQLR